MIAMGDVDKTIWGVLKSIRHVWDETAVAHGVLLGIGAKCANEYIKCDVLYISDRIRDVKHRALC